MNDSENNFNTFKNTSISINDPKKVYFRNVMIIMPENKEIQITTEVNLDNVNKTDHEFIIRAASNTYNKNIEISNHINPLSG